MRIHILLILGVLAAWEDITQEFTWFVFSLCTNSSEIDELA